MSYVSMLLLEWKKDVSCTQAGLNVASRGSCDARLVQVVFKSLGRVGIRFIDEAPLLDLVRERRSLAAICKNFEIGLFSSS